MLRWVNSGTISLFILFFSGSVFLVVFFILDFACQVVPVEGCGAKFLKGLVSFTGSRPPVIFVPAFDSIASGSESLRPLLVAELDSGHVTDAGEECFDVIWGGWFVHWATLKHLSHRHGSTSLIRLHVSGRENAWNM